MRFPALEPLVDRLKNAADAFDGFAARRFAFAERDDRLGLLLGALLIGHVLVWTLQPMLSHENLADSVDMVENWVWGKEWQWGYWKHPPFFAWVTGAWFTFLPRAEWAYYLLAALNAAVGLLGVRAMVGIATDRPAGRRGLLAVAALAITPIYGFLALKFNANAILLAVWPWATWAFLKAMRAPTAVNGAVLGALLGVAMLSKYVSLVVVIGMIAVVLADPRRWALARSPAALAAFLVGAIVVAPHVVWMIATDFRTLAYAEHQAAASTGQFLNYLVRLPLSMALFLLPALGVILVALPRADWPMLRRILARAGSEDGRRRLLGFTGLSFLTMVLLGVWKWAKLSSQWGFPLMYPVPWLVTSTPGLDDRRFRLDRLAASVVLVWAGLIVTAPIVDVAGVVARTKVHLEPRAELGREVTRIWREAAGGAPLDVVAGTFDLASNVAFYSPDAPSMLIEFDREKSPWITPDRLARRGVAVVCRLEDEACARSARDDLATDAGREVTVAKRWYGLTLRPFTVRLFLRLPTAGA